MHIFLYVCSHLAVVLANWPIDFILLVAVDEDAVEMHKTQLLLIWLH